MSKLFLRLSLLSPSNNKWPQLKKWHGTRGRRAQEADRQSGKKWRKQEGEEIKRTFFAAQKNE